jgi:hypothetical protein
MPQRDRQPINRDPHRRSRPRSWPAPRSQSSDLFWHAARQSNAEVASGAAEGVAAEGVAAEGVAAEGATEGIAEVAGAGALATAGLLLAEVVASGEDDGAQPATQSERARKTRRMARSMRLHSPATPPLVFRDPVMGAVVIPRVDPRPEGARLWGRVGTWGDRPPPRSGLARWWPTISDMR